MEEKIRILAMRLRGVSLCHQLIKKKVKEACIIGAGGVLFGPGWRQNWGQKLGSY